MMGTKTNPRRRRRRAPRRGLASFVSFLLLFAFALGQSSISALANDAGTDPVAEEAAAEDGLGELPVAESPPEEAPAPDAPVDEAPADEADEAAAPAEEAPADEAAAEEAPANEPAAPAGDATGDSDGGAASASSTGSGSSARSNKRLDRNAALAAPIGVQQIGLEGGDVSLDFIAAGPFTYDHQTGLGTYPTFGYNDRHIDKNDGVVESLESGDFECDELVTFFTQIVIEPGAAGSGDIELDYTFGNEPTGQDGLGFDDIVSVAINTPDDGNVGNVADNVVTLSNEFIETMGYDQVHGTVTVTNLAPGETAILRIIVHLECVPGSPTGNILNDIQAARVISPEEDTISVGQQTVPMKVTGFVPAPAIDIEKTCPAEAPFGSEVTFDITITNNGNESLDNIVVTDTVDGNAPVDISNLFVDTLAPGASDSAQFVYDMTGSEPDPLTNSVTVTADGVSSNTQVTDTSQCDTDITHEPGIDVTKSCPAEVPFGQDVDYTITVENTGNEPLVGVTVNDTLLGDITGDFDFDFSNPFPVGETATANVTYSPQPGDPDPLVNTVTASGFGQDSQTEATDEASCETDITHEPGIDVTKSCPGSVPAGSDISYTITVENTGNEPLVGVTVNDTLLGDITGDFDFDFSNPFPVGETATANVTYSPQPGDPDPLVNTVTASGTGEDSETEATDVASCVTDILNPSIDVTKSCTPLAHVGDTVTYTITVTNDGDEDLTNVTVVDTILGDLSAAFADDLAVGASESHDFDHVVQAGDPDPLINEVTATGLGVQSETLVDDTAECVTDIIHPGIQIVKTVDEDLVPVGTTVTYTYVVTNTGDTTLYDVSVDDDVMGHIGDIPILEPGQSVTLTADFVVGEDPVTNVATASGEDVLGHSVSATDDVVVTPIAGENPSPPSAPPTPFTGSDAGRLGLIAMGLLGIGATLVAVTRRRRTEDGTV
jgi:uncharacterized repeat protein (TIGR01451 family)